MTRRQLNPLPLLRWAALYGAATLLFADVHDSLRVSHGVIVYLLIIIGASTAAGRLVSVAFVIASYLAVDWFFIPPVGAFGVPKELDGVILAGFLATGLAVSTLLISFRAATDRATERAREVQRLSEERSRMAEEVARAAALREAEEVKTALLNSIAHDLRTPLSAIRLAVGDSPGTPAALVAEQVRLLEGYVEAVQTFGRTGPVPARRHDANVAEDLVGAAVRSARAALGDRPLNVRCPEGNAVLVGEFDFALALRALVNLIENAARYAPVGTPIDVALSADAGRVRISVLDRGPGLSDAEAGRAFDPFVRGSAASGTRGSGLGLAIARTFARAQGGDVRYEPRDGGGASFTLELPLRAD